MTTQQPFIHLSFSFTRFHFTELEALKNDVLTYGKIRASYAEVGQAGTYYPSYYRTPVYGGGFSSGTPIQYPNRINQLIYPILQDL